MCLNNPDCVHYPDLPKEIWKSVDWESCEDCGYDVECFTKAGGDQVYDGDDIICLGCGKIGIMSADGECAWASWDED